MLRRENDGSDSRACSDNGDGKQSWSRTRRSNRAVKLNKSHDAWHVSPLNGKRQHKSLQIQPKNRTSRSDTTRLTRSRIKTREWHRFVLGSRRRSSKGLPYTHLSSQYPSWTTRTRHKNVNLSRAHIALLRWIQIRRPACTSRINLSGTGDFRSILGRISRSVQRNTVWDIREPVPSYRPLQPPVQ